jgi:hypothetical protein
MDPESLFFAGERGYHLLFDPPTIEAAYAADPAVMRTMVTARRREVEASLASLLACDTAAEARDLIGGLSEECRHVLVLLYFELLEGRVRRHAPVTH